MRVIPVPCLQDNYAYLLVDDASKRAVVIDPGQASPVLDAVAAAGVSLIAVWATHHHPDHVGGIPALLATLPNLVIVASHVDGAKIVHVTQKLADGETLTLGTITATAISNPGHTNGAISFYARDAATPAAPGAVFTGDTMFAAGCGRLFEGTAQQMFDSFKRLAALPGPTEVYFGHEYTAANLAFAASVEPNSTAIAQRQREVAAARSRGEFTTPSSMALELATNPFARAADAAEFAARRTDKDSFKA